MKGIFKYNGTFLPAALLAGILFMAGCSRENLGTGPLSDEPIPITLTMPMRVVDYEYEDDGIEELRLIIMYASSGKVFYNEKIDPATLLPSAVNGILGTTQITLFPGSYNFFVIANEKTTYKTALEGVSTLSDIQSIIISKINLDESEEENVEGYPAGVLIKEEELVPFIRTAYLSGVRIGNYTVDPDTSAPQVSLNGGVDWRSDIPFDLVHAAVRVNLGIRKNTGPENGSKEMDRFFVTDLRLLRVPGYAYMLPGTFTGNEFNSLIWYKYTGLDEEGNPVEREPNDYFQENNNGGVGGPGTYTYMDGSEEKIYVLSNRKDVILPEYIMAQNTNKDEAVILEVRGDYEEYTGDGTNHSWAAYKDVSAMVPLPTGSTGSDLTYDMRRNMSYMVLIDITHALEYHFIPEVSIAVAEWDQDVEGYYNAGNGNVSLSGSWSRGTADASDNLYVAANDYVEYSFSFARTGGDKATVRWKAVLSNPVDFELVTEGEAVADGYARPGDVCKVRIKPTAASYELHSTKLYINIDDGVGGTIKFPLSPDYTIYQIIQ